MVAIRAGLWKWIGITILAVALLAVGPYYLWSQSPLKVNGIMEDEGYGLILELVNHGYADIRVLKVRVNGEDPPTRSDMGVSRSMRLVQGSGLTEDPDISFHPIKEVVIEPELSPDEKQEAAEREEPIHYGLRLTYSEPIESVEVIYRYLGMKYTKSFTVHKWPESNF